MLAKLAALVVTGTVLFGAGGTEMFNDLSENEQKELAEARVASVESLIEEEKASLMYLNKLAYYKHNATNDFKKNKNR